MTQCYHHLNIPLHIRTYVHTQCVCEREEGQLTKNDLHGCCDRVGGAEDGVGEGVGVSTWHHPQPESGLDRDEPGPLEVNSSPVLGVEQEPIEQLIEETISSYTDNTGTEREGDGGGGQGRERCT